MNVVNCKGCGRLFNAITKKRLCPDCLRKLEEKFQEVKRYIEDNKGAGIKTVAKACDVSVKQIKDWVKEERLIISEEAMDGVRCEMCGRMICTGRYCLECKGQLASTLQSALNNKVPYIPERKQIRDRERMRFLQQQPEDL